MVDRPHGATRIDPTGARWRQAAGNVALGICAVLAFVLVAASLGVRTTWTFADDTPGSWASMTEGARHWAVSTAVGGAVALRAIAWWGAAPRLRPVLSSVISAAFLSAGLVVANIWYQRADNAFFREPPDAIRTSSGLPTVAIRGLAGAVAAFALSVLQFPDRDER